MTQFGDIFMCNISTISRICKFDYEEETVGFLKSNDGIHCRYVVI